MLGDLKQPLAQLRGHSSRRLHRRRRQPLDELQDPRRRRLRGLDLPLKAAHEALALVEATDREKARGREAVRGREDVVRDDDARLGAGLVEGAELLQVRHALGELPGAVQGVAVEVLQGDTARAVVSDLHEGTLHVLAFGVLPPAIPLPDLLHNHGGGVEGQSAGSEFDVGGALLGLDHHALHIAREPLALGPAGPGRALLPGAVDPELRRVLAEHVNQHVRVHYLFRLPVEDERVDVDTMNAPGALQCLHRLVVHKVLQGGRQDAELVHGKASAAQPLLKERLDIGGHSVLEDLRGRARAPGLAARLQAADVDAVALNEEPVEEEANRCMLKVAEDILGHGEEHRKQGFLDLGEALAVDAAAAQGGHQLVQHGRPQLLGAHRGGRRAAAAAEDAPERHCWKAGEAEKHGTHLSRWCVRERWCFANFGA
mmetsp:Transcript_71290/g.202160  ORF Transcript_71290/g.202160 Transcript_71290/m.202160 type:complete len:429 (+) Transcript_71290:555-1841(+)